MGFTRTSTYNSNSSSGAISSLAYNGTLTAGSLLIVWVTFGSGNGGSPPSVSGTNNGSFGSAIKSVYDSGPGQGLAIFALVNGSNTSETINFTNTTNWMGIIIEEWIGCASSSPADGSAGQAQDSGSGGTNSVTSGNFSATSGDLVLSCTVNNSSLSSLTAGSAFNSDLSISSLWGYSGYFMITESQTLSGTTASGAFSASSGSGEETICICAAFKAAVGGSGANFLQQMEWWGRLPC
ncbi:MAG: hypothetical protein WAN11_06270 [Syntrophobacteraceae bacterium]